MNQTAASFAFDIFDNINPSLTQSVTAATFHMRIGVAHAHSDPANSGGDYGFGTGGGAPRMVAGFQCYAHGMSAGHQISFATQF
jgi:hypothetical protein